MRQRLCLQGGRIVDPVRGIDQVGDIHIADNKIVDQPSGHYLPSEIIDVSGHLVLPGLIDFHAHLFFLGADNGVPPDLAMLPCGVTTAIDAGSAGASNYELFHRTVVVNSLVRIKSFLNVASLGLTTFMHPETTDPHYFDKDKIYSLFNTYSDEIIGLKVRQSKEIVEELCLKPLISTVTLASELSCPVVVHTTNPCVSVKELVNQLRPNDVYAHVYQGVGNDIIGIDGAVDPAIKEARLRGVVFDAANGLNNFSLDVAKQALADGFYPDVISSDLTTLTWNKPPVYGLPYIMSKYLNMGLSLNDIIAACTAKPARLMRMEGQIGTLAQGAYADVAIFRLEKQREVFTDVHGSNFTGSMMLIPEITIRNGIIVFRNLSF